MFHVAITPKRKNKKHSPEVVEEPEELEVLSLAPFSPTPKIDFDNVKIGVSVTKKICIRNPTKNDIKIYLIKRPPDERNIKFNWNEQIIHAAAEEMLEIMWLPLIAGGWRDTITLTDNGRVRRDIAITLKCIKSPTKNKRKPLGVTLTKKKLSPNKKSNAAPSRPVLKNSNTNKSTKSRPNSQVSFNNDITYNVQQKENIPLKQNPTVQIETEENFDDSLEMPKYSNVHSLKPSNSNQNGSFKSASLPYTPDRLRSDFCCSTGRKSFNSSTTSPSRNILGLNLSSETYIKGNTSSETYVKDNHLNISGETYIKSNLSGGTYVKDSSIGNLADLELSALDDLTYKCSNITLSPIVGLGVITEESSTELTPKTSKRTPTTPLLSRHSLTGSSSSSKQSTSATPPRRSSLTSSAGKTTPKSTLSLTPKRVKSVDRSVKKDNLTFEIRNSPKKLSPVKRLSKAYNLKPMHLKQFVQKPTSPRVITAIAESVAYTHKTDMCYNNVCNPYVLAQTSGMDPFMSLTMYYDPQWVDEQILGFTNWLNVLLRPPKDMNCSVVKVDVAKMWQESKNKEVNKAPTKEEVSNKYNTCHLLQSLRHLASKLYISTEIIVVLSKTHGIIENNKFVIRTDKDLHQDVRLQRDIMQLFFCYNPLWLRIGLEQVYGCHIQLRSNSDCLGLSKFLMMHFFNNQNLLKKYKHKTNLKYAVEMKKIALKKFLSLVYFLDRAKLQKLIPYDPCLFVTTAPIKESREILLRFSTELFFACGDVTKSLRLIGYVLQYKQTYIHEFDYGIENLGNDLKDGVRLTRVMEIILLENRLSDSLRVPAISKLQKIHNVKLAFDALKRAGYTIESNIEPKDIVEGHKEKTLSFLWQIIYKFQSPRYAKAVLVVQLWWRSDAIKAKLCRLRAERKRKNDAAITIQNWFKKHLLRRRLEHLIPQLRLILEDIKLNRCAVVIQKNYRMYTCRRYYLRLRQSVLVIQKYFRVWYQFSYLRQKRNAAALVIQNLWKSYKARIEYLRLKQSVAVITQYYLAHKEMQNARNEFAKLKSACVLVQRKFRGYKLMKITRENYLLVRSSVIKIQTRWRATLLMRKEHNDYLMLRSCNLMIQRKWRATVAMREDQAQYKIKKQAIIKIQIWFKSLMVMWSLKRHYLDLKNAVICVQRRFRANLLMKHERMKFIILRQHVVNVQRRFRTKQLMVNERSNYLRMTAAVIKLQKRFRANILMKTARNRYLLVRLRIIKIQTRWRATLLMRKERNNYLRLRNCILLIQTKWRATMIMRTEHAQYKIKHEAIVKIQRWFRSLILMRSLRKQYLSSKNAVVCVQRRFRANLMMKHERMKFVSLRQHVVNVQRRFRANILMKTTRNSYLSDRMIVICIQNKWRATLLMRKERNDYLRLRNYILLIQTKWRATMIMRADHAQYKIKREAIVKIQRCFRHFILMRMVRSQYLDLKNAVVCVQRRFRANLMMKHERMKFVILRQHVVNVQKRFRANMLMKTTRNNYLSDRMKLICVQNKWRATLLMRKERNDYLRLRNCILLIQTKWRATMLMREEHAQYIITHGAIVKIQRCFRSLILMRIVRNQFLNLKNAVVCVQRRFRANLMMKHEILKFVTLRQHVLNVQRRFRANILRKNARSDFLKKKQSVVKIQEYFRGYVETKQQKIVKVQKLRAILLVQTFARGVLARKYFEELNNPEVKEQRRLERLRKASAIKIQAFYRGYRVRANQSRALIKLRMSLEAVCREAKPEDTVHCKTIKNVKILLTSKPTLIQYLGIYQELEKLTRISQRACVSVSKVHLCIALYDSISVARRSRADFLIGSAITGILINVAKYHVTNSSAWVPEYMEKVIQVMVRNCDKEYDYFCKLATLLWVFGHDEEQKKVICESGNLSLQMSKMHTQCERQQKMITKAYKRKNASVFAMYETLPLPTVKPDWGLDYAHAPHVFTNSVHAIYELRKLFNV